MRAAAAAYCDSGSEDNDSKAAMDGDGHCRLNVVGCVKIHSSVTKSVVVVVAPR